jgi:hypothetical protein
MATEGKTMKPHRRNKLPPNPYKVDFWMPRRTAVEAYKNYCKMLKMGKKEK